MMRAVSAVPGKSRGAGPRTGCRCRSRIMLRVLRPAVLLSVSLVAIFPSLASAQATKAGVVTTLEGNVTVTRVTLAPQPLKFKDDVFVDDKVVTGEQSIARMLLGGKAVVT